MTDWEAHWKVLEKVDGKDYYTIQDKRMDFHIMKGVRKFRATWQYSQGIL